MLPTPLTIGMCFSRHDAPYVVAQMLCRCTYARVSLRQMPEPAFFSLTLPIKDLAGVPGNGVSQIGK